MPVGKLAENVSNAIGRNRRSSFRRDVVVPHPSRERQRTAAGTSPATDIAGCSRTLDTVWRPQPCEAPAAGRLRSRLGC